VFLYQAEDGIRDFHVTGVQTCALPIYKTGTLTKGRPEVTEVKSWDMDENMLLGLVAEAEKVSEHHLGQTVVAEAKKRDLTLNQEPQSVDIIKGGGMVATVAGQRLAIGNRKLMAGQGVAINDRVEAYAT